jgi:hypothetical protein
MPCYLPPSIRDTLVRLFRAEVYRRTGFVEFPHQADFRLASEGSTLTTQVVEAPDEEPPPFDPSKVQPQDYLIKPGVVKLLIPCDSTHVDAFPVGETGNYGRYEWRLTEPRKHIILRPEGPVVYEGVVAHKVSDLASFKAGKSKGIGMWASGFACLPGATIDMVGLEYATSEHEWAYLREALLKGSTPFVKKPVHDYDDVRGGRMYLELVNGCSYGGRSWKNKDKLRGGQITCYIWNEIYQLPGLHVHTGHAQNLRAEQGFAAFTSTPDKPWVKVLHKLGHGRNPDWHCCCDNDASVNPYTFSLNAFMDDAPDWDTIKEHAPSLYPMCLASGLQPGALMSREKFLISWLGQLGNFAGRVYTFNRVGLTVYPDRYPNLFKPAVVDAWHQRQAQLQALRTDAHRRLS